MRSLSFILILIFIIACSPQKKLNRLIKNHPELLTQDTLNLVIHDTIYVENTYYDTVTQLSYHDSTIVVNNEKVYLKYFYDTLTREIFHEVTCYGDTVYYTKEIPVIVDKIVIKELTWWQKYGSIIIISGVLLLFLILLKRFGKLLL
jgi:hypothetical protein|tara:strand:- start:10 stop:450 length:441 start_codon:yes stop_codon:yes gene_type:complete